MTGTLEPAEDRCAEVRVVRIAANRNAFELSVDEWRLMMATNVDGMFYVTRAILPHFRERRAGHMVNISSISGRPPLPGGCGYAASKYAVADGRVAANAWKITPEDVGQACQELLATGSGTCISHLEIRPLQRPPKQ